ncbi:MAG: glycosyl hydrolase [Deltaproteobacteria bacterium]|nr:glycosyl hydrolase [Deltaproteobacteria bacterium]
MGRATALPLALALSAAGCLPQAAVVRLASPTRIAVATVVDFDDQVAVAAIPQGLAERIDQTLASKNLVPQAVPFVDLAPAFVQTRDTPRRLAKVVAVAGQAPLLLLVETKALFFSQLNGRYKWTVVTRVTVADARDAEHAQQTDFELAAILDFAHEREAEALMAVAPVLADRIGVLLDRFLSGQSGAPPAVVPDDPEKSSDRDSSGLGAIYFVLVDRFANGDPGNDGAVDRADPAAWHGGDLRGVIDHLDSIASLGVRTVWLSPVFASRQGPFFGHGAFHGYWVEDLRRLEPRFGTEAELQELSAELHRRGMKLVLDVVLNHVGYEAPLTREHPDWFHRRGSIKDWNDPEELSQGDVHGLPDLAVENDAVYRYLLESTLLWVERVKPDGLRLDAVKHVPTAFWQRYVGDVRARAGRELALVGEIFEGAAWRLAAEQRAGGFGAVFDFPLHYALKDVFCADAPPGRIAAVLAADREYDDPSALVTFLDNHDLPRILSACHDDPRRVLGAMTMMLSLRGVPAISYGTEVGLAGAAEPANRADMRFDAAAPQPLATRIRTLLAARQAHRVLARGATRVLALGDRTLSLARTFGKDVVLVLANRDLRSRVLTPIPTGGRFTAVDLVRGGELRGEQLTLEAGEVTVLLLSPDGAAARSVAAWVADYGRPRRVRFTVFGRPAADAQIFVVGLGRELGNWEPSHGVGPLAPEAEHLTGEVELPVGGVFEYKLVAKESDRIRWEGGENRYLFVGPGAGRLDVELTFDAAHGRPS